MPDSETLERPAATPIPVTQDNYLRAESVFYFSIVALYRPG